MGSNVSKVFSPPSVLPLSLLHSTHTAKIYSDTTPTTLSLKASSLKAAWVRSLTTRRHHHYLKSFPLLLPSFHFLFSTTPPLRIFNTTVRQQHRWSTCIYPRYVCHILLNLPQKLYTLRSTCMPRVSQASHRAVRLTSPIHPLFTPLQAKKPSFILPKRAIVYRLHMHILKGRPLQDTQRFTTNQEMFPFPRGRVEICACQLKLRLVEIHRWPKLRPTRQGEPNHLQVRGLPLSCSLSFTPYTLPISYILVF